LDRGEEPEENPQDLNVPRQCPLVRLVEGKALGSEEGKELGSELCYEQRSFAGCDRNFHINVGKTALG
jgi:hypothetical protein